MKEEHQDKAAQAQTDEPVAEAQQAEEVEIAEVVDIEVAQASEEGDALDLNPDAEINKLRDENKRLSEGMLRVRADLENYRRRAEREKQDTIKYANKTLLLDLLNVVDNFDRAMQAVTDPKDPFAVGVDMIHKQLLDLFKTKGVELIEAEGRPFDPYLHEAVANEETDEYEENVVISVFQKGYRYYGQLLRPASVKVAKAPVAETAD